MKKSLSISLISILCIVFFQSCVSKHSLVSQINEGQTHEEIIPFPASSESPDDVKDEPVFIITETMTLFKGTCTAEDSNAAIQSFIGANIIYPIEARQKLIQGKVYVSFIVEKDGQVSHVKLLRGVDPTLNNEAIRVIKSLPDFTPGMQKGKPVRVCFNVPINFRLSNLY